MGVEVILEKLDGVVKTKRGWMAFCPSHADNKRSLSIFIDESGRIGLHCFAGCQNREIMGKLGISWKDVHGDGELPKRRIVDTYDYLNEDGELVYQVVRFEPKGFAQRMPKDNGEWIWSIKDARKVIYNLPLINSAGPDQTIWFVEGEKDANRLIDEGLLATCIAGGANARWDENYTRQLTMWPESRLAIICDSDQPGRDFAWRVVRHVYGRICEIVLLDLFPSENTGADVSDFLSQGGTVGDIIMMVEEARTPTTIKMNKRVDGLTELQDFFG